MHSVLLLQREALLIPEDILGIDPVRGTHDRNKSESVFAARVIRYLWQFISIEFLVGSHRS